MKHMKKILILALLTVGAVMVSAGAAMIYPPAGCISGGVFLLAAGVLDTLGGGGDD